MICLASYKGSTMFLISPDFILTSLVVILLPGTGVIYTISIGLGRGFGTSVAAAFGCTLGILPAALASIVGLAAMFHTSAIGFQIIKYLGVAYLFHMAFRVMNGTKILTLTDENSENACARDNGKGRPGKILPVIMTGSLVNILNPKLSVFFLAFLPQFIAADDPSANRTFMILAFEFMVMTFAAFILYGAFASYARIYVIKRPAVLLWVKRCFAGVFGLLGIRLYLSE